MAAIGKADVTLNITGLDSLSKNLLNSKTTIPLTFTRDFSLKTGTANILQGSSTDLGTLKKTFSALQLPDYVFQLSNKIDESAEDVVSAQGSANSGAVLELYFSILCYLYLQGKPLSYELLDEHRKKIKVTENTYSYEESTQQGSLTFKLQLKVSGRATRGVSQKKKDTYTEFVGPNAAPLNQLDLSKIQRPLRTMISSMRSISGIQEAMKLIEQLQGARFKSSGICDF